MPQYPWKTENDSQRDDMSGGDLSPYTEARVGWWIAPEDGLPEDEAAFVQKQRANSLLRNAQSLEDSQREIHNQHLWSAQLYSNRELAAFDWGNGQLYKASLEPVSRTGENITIRVVDTLVSQIGKNRPKPKPVARGASFTLRQSIRKLDKFLYGEFQRNKVYALGRRIFRDACIFGFGCAKVWVEGTNDDAYTCIERVFPDEILIDQMEVVASGTPRHLYRRRVLPIEIVAETYGVDEADIREAINREAGWSYLDYRPVGAGFCVVVEGYQKDGRWMAATNNLVLAEGPWKNDWFPYVFYHYQDPVSGFYSASVVEQVLPYQIRLNEINEVIRDAQDLMGRPRILVAKGSQVNPLEIDNVIGRFISYTGIKPEAVTWPAISAELYNERERLVQAALVHFGISSTSANAEMPSAARYDSAPAMRELNVIQDGRLADPAQRYEDFYLELAERMIECIRTSGTNPKTVWYSGYKQSKAEEIRWDEMDLEENAYVMSMEATSLHSMGPAAARDELEKQLAMGLITPEQYRLELADPDSESSLTIQSAAASDLLRVQELLETGEMENPIPEQDLVSGITQMTLALLNLNKYKDVKPQTKLNIINWITLARAIVTRATEEEAAATPPLASGDPMGAMMPPPMPGAGGQGPMVGPAQVPVPEAMGLAPNAPGVMPGI